MHLRFSNIFIADLKCWGFNPFQYSEKDLLPLIKNMYVLFIVRIVLTLVLRFEDFGLMERFRIPVPNLERFIMSVRDNYQGNSYHNFIHAFDVTQTIYCFLTEMVCSVNCFRLD